MMVVMFIFDMPVAPKKVVFLSCYKPVQPKVREMEYFIIFFTAKEVLQMDQNTKQKSKIERSRLENNRKSKAERYRRIK